MHHTMEFEKERLRSFLNISRAYILEPLGKKNRINRMCVCACMHTCVYIHTYIHIYKSDFKELASITTETETPQYLQLAS